jgi:folate-binding protein YgfZ
VEADLNPDADQGKILTEWQALNHSSGLIEIGWRGRILLSGADAADLLNRISTNDIRQLTAKDVCDTVLTSPKGRIIDRCRLIDVPAGILLLSARPDTENVAAWINRYIIMEDVQTADVSAEYLHFQLLGPRSPGIVRDLTEVSAASGWPIMIKNNEYVVPAFDLILIKTESINILSIIDKRLQFMAGSRINRPAWEALRVESVAPAWGSELSEAYNPHEAGLTGLISFSKGCYVGQEVIARLDAYDKVQKYLTGMRLSEFPASALPLEVVCNDEKIGELTSVVQNPESGLISGLGYIRRNFMAEQTNSATCVVDGRNKISAAISLPSNNR